MTTCQVLYRGRVQGVGFRYQAKRLAEGFEITGCIENFPDGTVLLQVTGPKEEVRDFLHEIEAESELSSLITESHHHTLDHPTPFPGFRIKR